MSGHSKWATIKHHKAAQDAKKGASFTKHANIITLAAQKGGDLDMNPSLKLAIDNAKKSGVPNSNIEKAIKRGTGESKEGTIMQELMYEGYGPANVAILVKCTTDNNNRSVTNIKTIFNKNGGNFGASVTWLFTTKGIIEFTKNQTESELEIIIIESGADDYEFSDNIVIVYTEANKLNEVKKYLENQNLEIKKAELAQVPNKKIEISDEDMEKVSNFIDKLEEDDDVTEVYTNL